MSAFSLRRGGGFSVSSIFFLFTVFLVGLGSEIGPAKAQFIDWTLSKTGSPTSYTAAGEVITYTYVITNMTNLPINNITVSDNKAGAVACPNTLAANSSMTCTATYTITATDVTAGQVTNTVTVTGLIYSEVQDTLEATFSVFHKEKAMEDTRATLRSFSANRLNRLIAAEPDRNRFQRRLPEAFWDDGTSTNSTSAFLFSGHQTLGSANFSFSTSLKQMAQSFEDASEAGSMTATDGVDVWIEAHYSQYTDTSAGTNISGRFGILFLGADFFLTDAVLVGGIIQFDWMRERGRRLMETTIEGNGVMAGPYISARLTQHLFFDARFAWGTSDNTASPMGTYVDKFSTERWLASAKLTGNWTVGDFRITPSASVIFVEERQGSYIDSLGLVVPAQVAALGRLAFGPEIAYRHALQNGWIVEPHISISGLWDFNKPGSETAGGFVTSGSDFRATLQGGVLLHSERGFNVRAVGTYDGIGAPGFENIGGQIWVNIPLNELPIIREPIVR